MNRLASEKSPYLLQHAGNPVDWRPWGEEAFRLARELDRPIFLSIGYATCHWCHVMAHESFEDAEVAGLMNRSLVCVKVDREERPDVDEQYMTVCGLLTGSGGWPLTVVMTPDGRPFFAATYIPRSGMLDLVPRLESIWRERREEVEKSATSITDALRQAVASAEAGGMPVEGVLARASAELASEFDEEHGGFGSAPKFPMPHVLLFLLRYTRRSGDRRALRMAEETLRAMRGGGIFDHVGWGFHRYSTDERWLVPHFEKMLYDQALLAVAYAEAFAATGNELYGRTAREVLGYVLRDLRLPEGGFASAEDADSEGEEGKFYLWPYGELRALLEPDPLGELERLSGVAPEGNWSDHRGRKPDNIIHTGGAGDAGVSALPEPIRRALFEARARRVRPLRDDKLLTDWNGLAVAALALGSRLLGEPAWAGEAAGTAEHVLRTMRAPGGGLLHRARGGEAAIRGYATDYAFMAWGLLELYEATLAPRHLRAALELAQELRERFVESSAPGAATLFLTARDAEKLLVRPSPSADGALPSAVSVAVMLLLRLGRMTGRLELEDAARSLIRPLVPGLEKHPRSHAFMLGSLCFLFGPSREIVIVGKRGEQGTEEMLRGAQRAFLPEAVLLFRDRDGSELDEIAPFVRELGAVGGKATAYVCRDRACDLPCTDTAELRGRLGG